MTSFELEPLLFEEEGTTLDFKRDEYLIFDWQKGTTIGTQADFIKDMLAFANTARRASAIILLGATKQPSQKAELVGIADKLDNANVEQFLNGKLNRPLLFSYSHLTIDGKVVGIIEIPTAQKRPLHLRKDFGEIKAHHVYLRRNSSNNIASNDEIANMGATDSAKSVQPSILVALASNQSGQTANLTTANLELLQYEKNIPDYEPEVPTVLKGFGFTGFNNPFDSRPNSQYYREKARYNTSLSRAYPIDLVVRNISGVVANDVRIELSLREGSPHSFLCRKSSFPKQPQEMTRHNIFDPVPHFNALREPITPRIILSETVAYSGLETRAEIIMGKMQPGQIVPLEEWLFVVGGEVGVHKHLLEGLIFGDEISQPIPVSFSVELIVTARTVSLHELTGRKFGFTLPASKSDSDEKPGN